MALVWQFGADLFCQASGRFPGNLPAALNARPVSLDTAVPSAPRLPPVHAHRAPPLAEVLTANPFPEADSETNVCV